MSRAVSGLVLPGDQAPACYGMAADGRFYSFEEQYGRAAVLILAGAGAAPDLRVLIDAFVPHLDAFAVRNADVLILLDDNPANLWEGNAPRNPIRTVDCGGFLPRCGVGAGDTLVLVLDRNLRVAMRSWPNEASPAGQLPAGDSPAVGLPVGRSLTGQRPIGQWTVRQVPDDTAPGQLSPGPYLPVEGLDLAAACMACLDRLPHEAARDAAMPAPVIVLPNLLGRELCRSLIERFERGPSMDGEVARIDAAGVVRSVIDHDKKHRRDMPVAPGTELHDTLRATLLGRCAPEIAKAFQVTVSHIDRILVARYDTTAGWFRRHRDNAAENVAFRQFAISVNLNTEDYQGGHLHFPEYNDHRYSPPTGAGMIFSTSVLHEAAAVTSGRRYVLLTFFHSEGAEFRRQAYLALTERGTAKASPPAARAVSASSTSSNGTGCRS